MQQFQKSGYQVVGLDAGGEHTLDTYNGATDPVVIVIGSEGKGISRLVRENCDVIMSIPMTDWVESLNASVAAGSVLSEFARQRRAAVTSSEVLAAFCPGWKPLNGSIHPGQARAAGRWVIVVDAVVIRAGDGEIFGVRFTAVAPRGEVVDLAFIGGVIALRPRAGGVFRSGHGPLLGEASRSVR